MKKPLNRNVREFTSNEEELKYYKEQLQSLQAYIFKNHHTMTVIQLDKSAKTVDRYQRMIKIVRNREYTL